jgi:hypothetical protein
MKDGHARWQSRLKLFKELMTGLTNRELYNMVELQRMQGDRMLESIAREQLGKRVAG